MECCSRQRRWPTQRPWGRVRLAGLRSGKEAGVAEAELMRGAEGRGPRGYRVTARQARRAGGLSVLGENKGPREMGNRIRVTGQQGTKQIPLPSSLPRHSKGKKGKK